jgi:hypothetical protein
MFVKATNGEIVKYPYSVGALRRDNPNVSFPKVIPDEVLAEHDVYEVKHQPAPDHDPETHFVEYAPVPALLGEGWVYVPSVRPLSAEQIAERTASRASAIRLERDRLLAETDWTALSDVTMSPEMAAYRQALRDVPAQPGFPDNVTWPAKPE